MNPLTEAELARVIELDAKATKAPWLRDQQSDPRMQVIAHGNEVAVYHREHARQVDRRIIHNLELCAEYRTLCPRLARELLATREKLKAARETLEGIAKSDYWKWDDGLNSPEQFVLWAKSRANFALTQLNQP